MHEKTRENRLRRLARRRGLSLIKYRNGAGFGLIDVDTNGLVLGDRDNVGVGYDLDVIEGELSQRRLVRPVKTCTECGTEFHARADAAYCSTACRHRAYRHRNANRNVPSAVGAGVTVAATIGSLISESDRITSELEKHTADMNYPGTDEFNAHTFPRHPFDDSAYEVLHDLAERMEQVSNDLYSAEEERQSYAALTPQQKTARTQELEEIAEDAEASAGRETEWERAALLGRQLGRRCRRN